METRKVIVEIEVPKMFSENDIRDVFYTLRWNIVSVKDNDGSFCKCYFAEVPLTLNIDGKCEHCGKYPIIV